MLVTVRVIYHWFDILLSWLKIRGGEEAICDTDFDSKYDYDASNILVNISSFVKLHLENNSSDEHNCHFQFGH